MASSLTALFILVAVCSLREAETVGVEAASAAAACRRPAVANSGGCSSVGLGVALLQTRHVGERVGTAATEGEEIHSGDVIILKVARTSNTLTAEKDGDVHTKWDHKGEWQRFVIEKETGSGAIEDGDEVFLTAWTGKRITVQQETVHAKWDHKGSWQMLTLSRKAGPGFVTNGDSILLRGHLGKNLETNSSGIVQARSQEPSSWQELIVEAIEPQTTTTTTTASRPSCVEMQSLGLQTCDDKTADTTPAPLEMPSPVEGSLEPSSTVVPQGSSGASERLPADTQPPPGTLAPPAGQSTSAVPFVTPGAPDGFSELPATAPPQSPSESPTRTPVPQVAQSTSMAPAGTALDNATSMQEILDRHNKYRCLHGAPPMSWNDEIAQNAQAWATSTLGEMQQSPWHRRSHISGFWGLGENLAQGVTNASAVDAWYDEIVHTRHGLVDDSSAVSAWNYTQIVWRSSTSLGCGVYDQLLVCQYGPIGNVAGMFSSEVAGPVSGAQC
mmetsp:Transcript_34257/g.86627  ORF Transcript_34257/g.86627 Transcript_34257/m.86627 type:complete len:500 (-) Transcript_34257:315-1814(-)